MVLAIYEVFGTRTIGSKVSPIGRVYGAKDAVDAIMEGIAYYSDKFKGDVKITELRVWGTDKGISKLDPNTLCDCHSTPLWKCSTVLPSTVSIASDGISFTARGIKK